MVVSGLKWLGVVGSGCEWLVEVIAGAISRRRSMLATDQSLLDSTETCLKRETVLIKK